MNLILERYVYQKKEIKNGEDYCGASCASMVSGDEPQVVADAIGPTVPDTTILEYLRKSGWKSELVVSGGDEKSGYSWTPADADFDKITAALKKGELILWHFPGHYTICTGINEKTGDFIFSDPAGDRRKGYFNEGGENVEYTKAFLIKQKMKPIWSIS